MSTLGAYNDVTDTAIAAIPEVRESRTYVDFILIPLVDGRPDFAQDFEATGTFNGRYFDQDKVTPTKGRMADAGRIDEAMINEFGAERLGYHVEQRLDLGVYDVGQISEPTFLAAPPPPVQIVSVTLVGIGVFPDEVLQDNADPDISVPRDASAQSVVDAPSGTLRLQGLILKHGSNDVRAFLDHLATIVPVGDVDIRLTSVDEADTG